MSLAEPSYPAVKCCGGIRVAPADALDAAADLTDRQHAQVDLLVVEPAKPRPDACVGALPLAQLRDDVGIQQVAQSSTGRP